MTPELKILFVEDLPTDVELAKRTLTKEGIVFQSRVVDTEADFLRELENFLPDIIISDYQMPQFNGMRALKLRLEKCPATPFILLTGSMNEEIAVECMKAGATDYIIKEHIARLPLAVKDALEKKKIILAKEKAELEFKESEERFRSLYNNSTIGLYRTTPDGEIIFSNPSLVKLLGYSSFEELAERNLEKDGFEPSYERKQFLEQIEMNGEVIGLESAWVSKNGTTVFIRESAKAIRNANGKTLYYDGTVEDITQRKKAEEKLKESEEQFRDLFENSSDLICTHDLDGNLLLANNAAEKFTGYTKEELLKLKLQDILVPENRIFFKDYLTKIVAAGKAEGIMIIQTKNGKRRIWEYKNSLRTENLASPIIRGRAKDITEQKRVETELRESEERFRSVAQSANDAIVTVDSNGIILNWNAGAERIFGYTEKEIAGKNLTAIIPQRYVEQHINGMKRIEQGGEHHLIGKTVEFHGRHKNGKEFPLELSLAECETSSGKFFTGIIRDITERKLAEEAIANERALLRTIIDLLPDAIYVKDNNGRKLLANPMEVRLSGKNSEAEVIGKTDLELYPDREDRLFEEEDKQVLQSGKSILDLEAKLLDKNGQLHWLLGSKVPLRNAKGEIKGIVGLNHDITERKLAEEEITKLSQAVEQSSSSVMITNPKGDIEYVNPKFTDLTGYTKEEVKGKNPRILKSGHQDQQYYKELWATILSGKTWSGEFLDKKKNGELYWESARISPMVNKDGDITHFVAVKEDITEKKKMIEELTIAKERAEEMSRLKSNFLNNMSHELRTPLNGILGYSDLLTSELTDPGQIEMTKGIYNSGKRLSETLNFILDLSEAETANIELVSKDIAVIPLAKNSIGLFEREATKKNLQIEVIIKDENIYASLDERLFSRILYILLDNAIKFTNKGEISIEIEKEIIARQDWLSIKIKDTGIGIASAKIDLIWQEFRQASEGLSRSFEGTGLGLTIAKKAVELMHGVISVESKLGIGSTFTLKFPAVKVSPQEEEVTQSMQTKVIPRNKEKRNAAASPLVLYVEDDFSNRHIVKLFLENIFELETAADGKTALQLAAGKKYELFLMDINLGGAINGMEVVNALRKMPQYAETPIIAVTAYAMGKEKAEFLNGGCTHYLAKPFKKQELIDLVSSALKNK